MSFPDTSASLEVLQGIKSSPKINTGNILTGYFQNFIKAGSSLSRPGGLDNYETLPHLGWDETRERVGYVHQAQQECLAAISRWAERTNRPVFKLVTPGDYVEYYQGACLSGPDARSGGR